MEVKTYIAAIEYSGRGIDHTLDSFIAKTAKKYGGIELGSGMLMIGTGTRDMDFEFTTNDKRSLFIKHISKNKLLSVSEV